MRDTGWYNNWEDEKDARYDNNQANKNNAPQPKVQIYEEPKTQEQIRIAPLEPLPFATRPSEPKPIATRPSEPEPIAKHTGTLVQGEFVFGNGYNYGKV